MKREQTKFTNELEAKTALFQLLFLIGIQLETHLKKLNGVEEELTSLIHSIDAILEKLLDETVVS